MIGEVDEHIEEKNESKYLVFDSADENREVLKKCTELWDGIKNEIEAITGGKEGEYGRDFMKIKFDRDDNLPLNKTLKLRMLTVIVRSVSEGDGRFYTQAYLDKCLHVQLDRIEDSEGIDLDKTDKSKECKICHYNYFDNGFKSDSKICNKCDWGIKSFGNLQ